MLLLRIFSTATSVPGFKLSTTVFVEEINKENMGGDDKRCTGQKIRLYVVFRKKNVHFEQI